jgi:large subunit ribosomal protein L15
MDGKTILQKGTQYQERKRIGRGIGSGSGKTSGRGHKGLGARSGSRRRPGYEGGQMPIYRRVPKRGFTNARFRTEYTVINVEKLNDFEDGATVDLAAVLEHGLVSMNTPLLKVLGNGDLGRKLEVRAQKFSKSARAKIESAGGSVVELDLRGHEAGAEGAAPEAPAAKPAAAKPAAEAAPEEEAQEAPSADEQEGDEEPS